MGEKDIAPDLLARIRKDFLELAGEPPAADSYTAAAEYAERVGAALAEALRRNLTADALPDGRLYWNLADRVVRPLLEDAYARITDVAAVIQQTLNQQAGLGLAPQRTVPDPDRVDGLLNKLSQAEHFEDVQWVLDEPVCTFSRMAVDDTLKANVEFQGKAGLRPRVVRTAESRCCKWCAALAGSYDYPHVPKDVYRRHERCRCRVEYDPGEGRRQNVWNKTWTEDEETRQHRIQKIQDLSTNREDSAKIEARKKYGLVEKSAAYEKALAAFRDEHLATSEAQLLPHRKQAVIPPAKVFQYALNLEHPTGRNKAIVFRDVLGYVPANGDELIQKIMQGLSSWKAAQKEDTPYGIPFEVKMLVTGPSGRTAPVLSAWIIKNGSDFPTLTSIYIIQLKGGNK